MANKVQGIELLSKRGTIGKSALAQQWMELVLYAHATRINQGKRLARAGKVLDVYLENRTIIAEVKDYRRRPFDVSISFDNYPLEALNTALNSLSNAPLLLAQLLAGILPPILLTGLSQPLMPKNLDSLDIDCDCYDYDQMCKHVVAVFCLMAEWFDEDPFILLSLRNITTEQITQYLRKATVEEQPAVDPLTSFWQKSDLTPLDQIEPEAVALAQVLSTLSLKIGKTNLLQLLTSTYKHVKVRAAKKLKKLSKSKQLIGDDKAVHTKQFEI